MKHKSVDNFIIKDERNHLRRSKWEDNIKTSCKTKNMCGYELGGKGDGRWSGRGLVNIIFKPKMGNFLPPQRVLANSRRHWPRQRLLANCRRLLLTTSASSDWTALRDTYWSRQRLLASSPRQFFIKGVNTLFMTLFTIYPSFLRLWLHEDFSIRIIIKIKIPTYEDSGANKYLRFWGQWKLIAACLYATPWRRVGA